MMANNLTIQIEPPEVDIDDVENFLAKDGLFVEYFNTYLSLPEVHDMQPPYTLSRTYNDLQTPTRCREHIMICRSFPEPLYFNKETGGFEVVSDARKELAQQLKAAIRSQRHTPKMYRVAKQHAFSDIPLVPIVPPEGPEKIVIDTTFSVTTLNKEQGIHWVKAERLPTFLQSDCYFEYRLGSILSQVRLLNKHGEFLLLKIDYKQRKKRVKKKQAEVKVNTKEVYIKNMFVCMGNAATTTTDAWFSQAQMAHTSEPTYISQTRPISASRPVSLVSAKRWSVPAARPVSVAGSYRKSDSGIGGFAKSTLFSNPYVSPHDSFVESLSSSSKSHSQDVDDMLQSSLFGEWKPLTPRPGEPLCVMKKEKESDYITVYTCPKMENTDSESGIGEIDRDEPEVDPRNDSDSVDKDKGWDMGKGTEDREIVVLSSLEELSEIIVCAVMKKAMADIAKLDQKQLQNDSQISSLFPKSKYAHISTDMLDNFVVMEEASLAESSDQSSSSYKLVLKKQNEDDSDADSLLDSEEDYEEEDRTFFRRHKKQRSYSLNTRRGIQEFKRFLKGTSGESYWHLWLDIDKLGLLTSKYETSIYLAHMREKYLKLGSPCEITHEAFANLGLSEPSWTVEKLKAVQPQVAKPLVLYWAPRFLLKQLLRTNPDKYQEYYQQKLVLREPPEVYPNPPANMLLPLRPKSCKPPKQHKLTVEDFCKQLSQMDEVLKPTSPPVGLRRRHGESATKRPSQPTVIPSQRATTAPIRKPKDLLSASLKSLDAESASAESSQFSVVSVSPHKSLSSNRRSQSAGESLMHYASPTPRRTQSAKHPSTHFRSQSSASDSSGSWEFASVSSSYPKRQSMTASSGAIPESREFVVTKRRNAKGNNSFLRGPHMEALLQALYHENDSGHFFRHFLQRNQDRRWFYAAQFWEDVQSYRKLFYQKSMDPYMVVKHAQRIYSRYIVSESPQDIGCSGEVRQEVYQHLDPPQEELFDQAEEEALVVLYSAWLTSLASDINTYGKVELIEVKRHLETKSNNVLKLKKCGLIKERPATPDEAEDGFEDPVYDPEVWKAVPEEFQDYTLEKLVHNRIELENFNQFLAEKYADIDLKCWMDIESWRRTPPNEEQKRELKAKDIKKAYLNKKYFFGPNSPAGKGGQEKVMQAGGGWGKLLEDRPPNAIVLEAQKYVRERLEKKWLPLFLTTETFAERQKPRTSMDDVVDDVLVQKKRRSQAVWKMLESRWVSSSKEILTFRKGLLNPMTSKQFCRFVSIKGDNLENDVLFWQEVQKYKHLHHAHTEDSLLLQKITAIINCFIDSPIPPSLQIDIPQEMAEKILDRKYERGPYLFREAQLAVFRILFSHWNEFCKLRMNLSSDTVLPTIERLRRHAKAKERRRQAERERKAEEEQARASEMTPEGGSSFHDPFMTQESPDEDEALENSYSRDKIEFSYASYMREFQREEVLNNTDESIFSFLTDTGSANTALQATNCKRSDSVDDTNANAREQTKSEETQMASHSTQGTQPVRRQIIKKDLSQDSSGNVLDDQKTAQETRPSETKANGSTSFTSRPGSGRSRPHPANSTTLVDVHTSDLKLSRQIPPLAQKR